MLCVGKIEEKKKAQDSGVTRAAKMVKIATVVASLSTFLISDRDEGSEG